MISTSIRSRDTLLDLPGTPECASRPGPGVLAVRWSIDGGGLSGLACRSPGPARSTCEKVADVHCGIGSWGGQRLRMADYVIGTGPRGGRPPPEGPSVGYPLNDRRRGVLCDYCFFGGPTRTIPLIPISDHGGMERGPS